MSTPTPSSLPDDDDSYSEIFTDFLQNLDPIHSRRLHATIDAPSSPRPYQIRIALFYNKINCEKPWGQEIPLSTIVTVTRLKEELEKMNSSEASLLRQKLLIIKCINSPG